MKNAVPPRPPSSLPSTVRTWQIAECGGTVVSSTPRYHFALSRKKPIWVVSASNQLLGR